MSCEYLSDDVKQTMCNVAISEFPADMLIPALHNISKRETTYLSTTMRAENDVSVALAGLGEDELASNKEMFAGLKCMTSEETNG